MAWKTYYLHSVTFVNEYDDRPSEPESGESADHRSFKNHKQRHSDLSSIALSSALMKGTFFYFGNAKYIVPIVYFNLYNFNGRLHDYQLKVRLLEGVPPLQEKRNKGILQRTH
jgi:hypothetical protein